MGLSRQLKRGLCFVISAPSGAGKTTLVDKLVAQYPNALARSISCTTRPPREGEREGIDYFFVSPETFKELLNKEAFLEHAHVFGYEYGTLKTQVENTLGLGKHVLLVIDTQGALYLKGKIEAKFVFILPPSLEVLQSRLQNRKKEDLHDLNLRLSWANREMDKAEFYDKVIVNDQLDVAYEELKEYIMTQEFNIK